MTKLTPVPFGTYCSAITGEATPRGAYMGPRRNDAPNPGDYWYGVVCTEHGMRHVQEVGRAATERRMIELGACTVQSGE
jgi:hypothetical protein